MLSFKKLKASHIKLGEKGEKLACEYLSNLGIEILLRNFRTQKGEIDIIARDGNMLCFVEVKTRHRNTFTRPADAVNLKKQIKISKTSKEYLRNINSPRIVYRYDIVEVYFEQRKFNDIVYIPNAFKEKYERLMFG